MSTALIIYGSTTGNTESAAETLEEYLSDNGYDVTMTDVSDTNVEVFKDNYDLFLLGCSTWGDEEIELQEDFESFFDDMKGISLNDKKIAVFGCGDSTYQYFCGAVDVIEERSGKIGGNVICESLRIDGDPEDDEINEWAQDVISAA